MRGADARELSVGQRVEPRFALGLCPWVQVVNGRVQLRPRGDLPEYRDAFSRTERLVERARRRFAPGKPSRFNSVFAARDPALWAADLAGQEQRRLVRLAPVPGGRACEVDARYLEQAFAEMQRFEQARTFGEKRRIVAHARDLARRYWTRPTRGRGARPDARPEVLLGGGARFLGVAAGR